MKIHYGFAAYIGTALTICSLTSFADGAQDQMITSQVQSAIKRNADVGTQVTVSTKDGVVYLKGNTSTSLAKSHAEDLAKAVPGVQKVVNDVSTEK
jgi:osmotically-inducible protein OsmY